MYAFLKNLIAFSVPLPLCLVIFSVSVALLWIKRTQRIGKIGLTSGFFILVACSFPFFPDMLLSHFEQDYPSFTIDVNGCGSSSTIKYVVVLAGSHMSDPKIPITGQFCYEGLVRLIEGIRVYKKCPGSKLVLSGGKGRNSNVSDAELMGDLALNLGVPKEDMILETESTTTKDEAELLRPILGDEKFVLVTSASHMPRAMGIFREMGMNPVAAPTGHLVKRYGNNRSWMPSVGNLKKSEAAFYEILATLKMKAGKLSSW